MQRMRPAGGSYRSERPGSAFATPHLHRSLLQIANTFLPFIALWGAMYWALAVSYLLVLVMAVPAAGLVVRIFIIQHDCGHGSFFKSRQANRWVGRLCSVFTFVPYAHWRRQHAGHHGNWNNLDRRESGADIYSSCLTVAEYRALSSRQRWRFRIVRNPSIALLLLPPLIFVALYWVPFDTPRHWRAERRSVWLTNAALVGLFGASGMLIGFSNILLVQLPITTAATIVGVWLFSLQHRFHGVQWRRKERWSHLDASLLGSSYLRLPKVLQWWTGNIGFHHIHHLNARIPNYFLEAAHQAQAAGQVTILTLLEGLSASRYVLWDEDNQRMVTFNDGVRLS